MGDKSPHDPHHSAKKSAKSIKQRRAEKKTQTQISPSQMARLTADARRHGT